MRSLVTQRVKRRFTYDPSLVLYLPLYELDGASFQSSDIYGRLCTVTGAIWTPDGRDFDGTDDRITIASVVPANTRAITIHAWAKLGATGQDQHIVVDSGWTASNTWVLGYVSAANQAEFALREGTGYDFDLKAGTIVAGSWVHYLVTYDIDGDARPYLYLNGVQNVGNAVASPTVFGTANDTWIGRNDTNTWDDLIGEVAIWAGKGASESEARKIYQQTKWRYQ